MTRRNQIARAMGASTTLLTFVIASLALIDNVFLPNINIFSGWGGETEMATPTAICIMLLSSALCLLAVTPRKP